MDLATGHVGALGTCDDLDRRELAIAGRVVYWLTLSRGNTESDEKVYSASRGQTRLLASYSELSCDDESTQCGADVFAGGGHAFVSHVGTIFQVEGSRLEPVLNSPGSSLAAVSWPYVALLHTHEISSPAGTEVRVYRLTDGKRVRTFHDDLGSGRELATIHDEAVIAIVGRQVITRAPAKKGSRYRLHSVVPYPRVLDRRIGQPPRLIVKTGGDVHIAQTFVDGRALSWIEEQSALGYGTRGFRLRKLALEAR